MSHTEVPEIELMNDGSLTLTVEVFGFEPGTQVEISGSAAQANGAIATFYDLQTLPPAKKPGGGSFVTVRAASATGFAADEIITVVGRASKIWGTVLYADPDDQRPGVKAVWATNPESLSRPA